MGKDVFPVFLEPCEIDGVLAEHQAVFVYKEGAAAYERLRTAAARSAPDWVTRSPCAPSEEEKEKK
jgi:hypothetical protein